MNNKPLQRIFGLDILRTIAIVCVVIGHSNYLLTNFFKGFPYIKLPDGVDLFFVLSGYLVGSIFIKTTQQSNTLNLSFVLYFLKRRWFRTLPNYFLFLIINIILIYFGLIKGTLTKHLITYFFFFQNFTKPYDFLFWESWSLAVEEWFYLLFPFIVLVFLKITSYKLKPKKVIFITLLLFLVMPLFYRIVNSASALEFDLYFRKLVVTRLDTIGFGLLGAFIHFYYPLFWNKTKTIFFVVGITLLIILLTLNSNNLYFLKTVYYSCVGISILFILPQLQSIKNETFSLKPFAFISKISFSIYLVHMPLLQILSKIVIATSTIKAILIYLFFWITTIVLSYLIYKLYEKPLMDLREKMKVEKLYKL